jgi:hypothetical protein
MRANFRSRLKKSPRLSHTKVQVYGLTLVVVVLTWAMLPLCVSGTRDRGFSWPAVLFFMQYPEAVLPHRLSFLFFKKKAVGHAHPCFMPWPNNLSPWLGGACSRATGYENSSFTYPHMFMFKDWSVTLYSFYIWELLHLFLHSLRNTRLCSCSNKLNPVLWA